MVGIKSCDSWAGLTRREEAARLLGYTNLTIGRLLAQERLKPATLNGEAGVTIGSVENEKVYRATTSPIRRLWELIAHWMSF